MYYAKYYGKGGGNGQPGEKMKLGVRENNEKRERKKEENYIKKGGKGLKNASFWVINSKIFSRGSSDPPARLQPKEMHF